MNHVKLGEEDIRRSMKQITSGKTCDNDNVMHTKSVAGIPVPESKCNKHCTRLTRLVHVSEFMITSGV